MTSEENLARKLGELEKEILLTISTFVKENHKSEVHGLLQFSNLVSQVSAHLLIELPTFFKENKLAKIYAVRFEGGEIKDL